ncbi:MAG: hypothetical protein LUC33_03070 [Prevotellaceae bacterium]|nr:hypothetical protein [Prevotellaceae bacterium]
MTCKELDKVRNLICKHPLCVKIGLCGQQWHIVKRIFRTQTETEGSLPRKRQRELIGTHTFPLTDDTKAYTMLCQDHYAIRLGEEELRQLANKEVVTSRSIRGDVVMLCVITAIRKDNVRRGVFTPKAFEERLELLRKAVDIKRGLKEALDLLESLKRDL